MIIDGFVREDVFENSAEEPRMSQTFFDLQANVGGAGQRRRIGRRVREGSAEKILKLLSHAS